LSCGASGGHGHTRAESMGVCLVVGHFSLHRHRRNIVRQVQEVRDTGGRGRLLLCGWLRLRRRLLRLRFTAARLGCFFALRLGTTPLRRLHIDDRRRGFWHVPVLRHETAKLVLVPDPLLDLSDPGVLGRARVIWWDVCLEVGLCSTVTPLLHHVDLRRRPRVEANGPNERNVRAEVSVNPGALDADEHSELAGRPARLFGRAIRANLVLGTSQQLIESLLQPLGRVPVNTSSHGTGVSVPGRR